VWINTGSVELDVEQRLLIDLGEATGFAVERGLEPASEDALPRLHLIVTHPEAGTRRVEVDLDEASATTLETLELPAAEDVAIADLDGDGILDLALMINSGEPTLTWALGQ
jgi:hypothetical protein